MILPGNLRATTLGDVLGRLHRLRASGVLELIDVSPAVAGRRHRIHLRSGLVTCVDTSLPVPPIGEMLVREGVLSKMQHQGFVQALRREARRAGEVLVETGMVSSEVLGGALKAQLRMRVDAVFGMKDAALRFHANADARERAASLPVSDFLYGRPRARDRARKDRENGPPTRHDERDDGRSTRRQLALRILGLRDGASRDEVRQTFRRLALTVHPDLHPHVSEAERQDMNARFAALSFAYHHLISQ